VSGVEKSRQRAHRGSARMVVVALLVVVVLLRHASEMRAEVAAAPPAVVVVVVAVRRASEVWVAALRASACVTFFGGAGVRGLSGQNGEDWMCEEI